MDQQRLQLPALRYVEMDLTLATTNAMTVTMLLGMDAIAHAKLRKATIALKVIPTQLMFALRFAETVLIWAPTSVTMAML